MCGLWVALKSDVISFTKVSYRTGNNAHRFLGERSKVKITRPITAETESVSYLAVAETIVISLIFIVVRSL